MPTIGVSVAVPEPWGSELQHYRVGIGDESGRRIPSHITLLPPYELTVADLDDVVEHLEDAARRTDPFLVHLRGTGTFRPVSPVVFVNVVEGISHCEQLAAAVRSGPLLVEDGFPYHPHVTVAHEMPEGVLEKAFVELERYDAEFGVEAFWLYVHDRNLGWQPARSFPLG